MTNKVITVTADVNLEEVLKFADKEDVFEFYGINGGDLQHKPQGQPNHLALFKKELTKTPLNKEELKELICNWIDENVHNVIF